MTLETPTQPVDTDTVNSSATATEEPSQDENSLPAETQEPAKEKTAVEENIEGAEANPEESGNTELIGGKFKTWDDVLKAYENTSSESSRMAQENSDLRKKAEIADTLEKQQLDIAKSYGFNSVEDMQRHQQNVQVKSEMAKFEANQYAQFLNLCDDPEGARELLILYAQNPTPELKRAIEEEAGFPIEVHKKVAKEMVGLESDFQQKSNQFTYEQEATKVKAYLENVTTQYPEEFKNKEFVALYGEAFKALGTNLETGKFIELLNGLKQTWISQHEAQKNQSQENNSAIEAIEGLSPTKNAQPKTKGGQEKDILAMTPEEMKKELKKYK